MAGRKRKILINKGPKVIKPFGLVEKDKVTNFIEDVVCVRRVTKVIKGGRRLGFSAFVVVGDGEGRVGIASGKGREVAPAISKALRKAKKNMKSVPLFAGSTLPYEVTAKFGASKVILRSAFKGTGVIAGGAVRSIMTALGVKDVLAKSFGSANPITVAYAVMAALSKIKSAQQISQLRGMPLSQIIGA